MKCFLHIGTEKTATTTLQRFLHLNREKFAACGFLLPKNVCYPYNHKLPILAYNNSRRDDLTNINGIYTEKHLIQFQEKIKEGIKTEITKSNQPTILFSSEHIQSRLTEIDEIERLKTTFEDLGVDDFTIIVYLRDPVEIAGSLYSTSIINGHIISTPPPPQNPYFNNICNHKNTLIKFESVFGKDNLKVRIFDKEEFKHGSIIDDFLDAIDMPLTSDLILPDNQNEGLSHLGLELLRRVNKKVPMFIDNELNPVRADIVNYFKKIFNDEKYVIPKNTFLEYESEFKESNE